jgi:DNA-binding transcriptional ArsR family regulator
MPINESEFNKSSRPPTIVLLEFLSANYRNAYSLDELAEVMSPHGMSKQALEKHLDALAYGGKIKLREVDGKTYYKHSEIAGMKLI